MARRTVLFAALAAVALLAGLAAPATADALACPPNCVVKPIDPGKVIFRQSATMSCTVRHATQGDYRLEAIAYYQNVPNATGLRAWPEFRYRLTNGGNKSNVNIYLYDGSTNKLSYKSPDNRHADEWYTYRPVGVPVTTTVEVLPNGEVDRSPDDTIQFQAIFDRPRDSDPRCWAWPGRFL